MMLRNQELNSLNKKEFDKAVEDQAVKLNQGDWVYMRNEVALKLEYRWTGPYRIRGVGLFDTYLLENADGKPIEGHIARDRLKPARINEKDPPEKTEFAGKALSKRRRQELRTEAQEDAEDFAEFREDPDIVEANFISGLKPGDCRKLGRLRPCAMISDQVKHTITDDRGN